MYCMPKCFFSLLVTLTHCGDESSARALRFLDMVVGASIGVTCDTHNIDQTRCFVLRCVMQGLARSHNFRKLTLVVVRFPTNPLTLHDNAISPWPTPLKMLPTVRWTRWIAGSRSPTRLASAMAMV